MEMNELKSEELEAVAGGQTSNPNEGHWQYTDANMGTAFIGRSHLWYRVKTGDTLGEIANRFGVTMEHIREMNPLTIQNYNQIFAGDTIVVKRNPTQWDMNNYPHRYF